MKHLLLFFMITVFAISVGNAATIEALGRGITREEARLNAQIELAMSISSTVSVSQRFISHAYQGTDSSSDEVLLHEEANQTTSLELLGVQYSNPVKDQEDNYLVTASLNVEVSLPQYQQKLIDIQHSIEELEKRNITELSLNMRMSHLLLLLRYYEAFELYRRIVITLDSESNFPYLQNTRAGVELDLLQVFKEKDTMLRSTMEHLEVETESSLQQTTDDALASIHMAQLSKELETNRKALESLQKEEAIRESENFARASKEIQQQAGAMEKRAAELLETSTIVPEGNDPYQFFKSIEALLAPYISLVSEMESQINVQTEPIITGYKNQIQALENQEFRTAEKLITGEPTEAALAHRANQIESLEQEMAYAVALLEFQMKREAKNAIAGHIHAIEQRYDALNSKLFFLNSNIDDFVVRVDNYDSYRQSWPLAIRFTLFGHKISYDIYLPYEAVTKESVPNHMPTTSSETIAYNTYLDTVDLFEAYFSNTENPLLIEVSYSVIQMDDSLLSFKIVPDRLNIIRSDIARNIFSASLSQSSQDELLFMYPSPLENQKNFLFYQEGIKIAEDIAFRLERDLVEQENLKRADKNKKILDSKSKSILSFSSLTQKPTETFEEPVGVSCAFSVFTTPISRLYVGISAEMGYLSWDPKDSALALDPELLPYSSTTKGLSVVLGVIQPLFYLTPNSGKLKAFADLRFGVFSGATWSDRLVTSIHAGLELSKLSNPLELNVSLTYQITGLQRGTMGIAFGVNVFKLGKAFLHDTYFNTVK